MGSSPAPAVSPPAHVVVASAVGTPLAGALILLANDEPLGQPHKSNVLLLPCGVVGLALAVALVHAPQLAAAWVVLNVVLALGMGRLAWQRQGDAWRAHLKQDGARQPLFFALAQGGFVVALLLGGTHLASSLAGPPLDGKVNVKGEQFVYHSNGGTVMDARALGDFLADTPFPGDTVPFFNGDHPADVRVARHQGSVVVSFVLTAGAWDSPVTEAGYRALGVMLAERVFPHGGLRVDLCDGAWKPQRQVTIR